MTAIAPRFSAREVGDDVTVVGVVATRERVRPMLRRLLDTDGASLVKLRVVASSRVVLILGAVEDLPWVDGATYLRRDGELLLPTWIESDVPAHVLSQRLRAAHPELKLPVVLLPRDNWLVSASEAAPPNKDSIRERLTRWT